MTNSVQTHEIKSCVSCMRRSGSYILESGTQIRRINLAKSSLLIQIFIFKSLLNLLVEN